MPHFTFLTESLPQDTVLIVGAGPVGLTTAKTLAHHGVRSVVLERNLNPTRWPKMDLTTARSMEIFKRLGIADELRARGVDSSHSFNCLFSTGLNEEKAIASWDLPSVDDHRKQIAETNDGTTPAEPWQRISQDIFEAWLRILASENDLIDIRFGWKVVTATEDEKGAHITAIDSSVPCKVQISSRYAVACDGANSFLRNAISIEMEGEKSPEQALLIHFKSKDLSRIHKQGQFWHIFFPRSVDHGGSIKGAIIAQDEIETWTVHCFLPHGSDPSQLSSEGAVASVLGGMGEDFPIHIDEVLVRSTWTPSIAVAKSYVSPLSKIILAGDSAHQTVPTGGYGMNTGIADAFDLGWKLAAILRGWGGPLLIPAYEDDRRPVAQLVVAEAKSHMMKLKHMPVVVKLDGATINQQSAQGEEARDAMRDYLQHHDGHNKSLGIEMGYRYSSSLSIRSHLDEQIQMPEFDPRRYHPSTQPGFRAPHVLLKDDSPIFDKLSDGFTLVNFQDLNVDENIDVEYFRVAAKRRGVPLSVVTLEDEGHARAIWGAKLVLVRPDGFVSWHGENVESENTANYVISRATGWEV